MDGKHTYFMLLKTEAAWLRLTPQERFNYFTDTLQPIFEKHPRVSLKFYDTEFFSSRVTDIAVWETEDGKAWQMLVEELREQLFWSDYFHVADLIPGVENAFLENYRHLLPAA